MKTLAKTNPIPFKMEGTGNSEPYLNLVEGYYEALAVRLGYLFHMWLRQGEHTNGE